MIHQNNISEELISTLCFIKPNGENLSELWKKCIVAVDKLVMARTLNYCVKMKMLYSEAGKYYSNPTKPLPAVKTPKRKAIVEPKSPIKPIFGTLRRGNIMSSVAVALFVYRNTEHMLPNRIVEIIGKPNLKILGALRELCEEGYAYRRTTTAGYAYKWTEYFDYPFKSCWPSDIKHIALIPENFCLKSAR